MVAGGEGEECGDCVDSVRWTCKLSGLPDVLGSPSSPRTVKKPPKDSSSGSSLCCTSSVPTSTLSSSRSLRIVLAACSRPGTLPAGNGLQTAVSVKAWLIASKSTSTYPALETSFILPLQDSKPAASSFDSSQTLRRIQCATRSCKGA